MGEITEKSWREISLETYAYMLRRKNIKEKMFDKLNDIYTSIIDEMPEIEDEKRRRPYFYPITVYLHFCAWVLNICESKENPILAETFKEYCESNGFYVIPKVFNHLFEDKEAESFERNYRELIEKIRKNSEDLDKYSQTGVLIDKIKEMFREKGEEKEKWIENFEDCFERWKKKADDAYRLLCKIDDDIKKNSQTLAFSKLVEKGTTLALELCELIETGALQVVLTGAPGTGKTYMACGIAAYCGTPQIWKKNLDYYELVQFHPSYDYTDFIEGLRPVKLDGEMQFVKMDGQFKLFCRRVEEANREDERRRKDAKYFFLIDEINRADLPKVFGELMYCLERDKRGAEHRVNTQYQSLVDTYDAKRGRFLAREEDVFADGFYIPENVVMIGTMNDIDRSVENMDFALRRRFEWKEIVVTQELLNEAFDKMFEEREDKEKFVERLTFSVLALNRWIHGEEGERFALNEQYDISQGQFANLPVDKKISDEATLKKYVWERRIEPLLKEYLRGEARDKIELFVEKAREAFGVC